MIVAASVISLLLGTALACTAERVPSHVALMEGGGGVLLLAGFALIGACLPFAP